MKIIAVYPGRFQPFHKGHGEVYKWLKNKFGNAHIATTNKVELPKSPFNFEEKMKMMTLAGVSPSDITEVKNPYISPEILRQYDGTKTVLVFAVSQKDMEEDPRFSFKPTKSGKPSYLQPFPKNSKDLQPFGDPEKPRGYVIVTPTFKFEVLGEPMKSATELRKQFAEADNATQKAIIKDLFGKYDSSVHKLMAEKIKPGAPAKSLSKIKKTLKEELDHQKFGPMLDSFVSFASDKLGLQSKPTLELKKELEATSFGGYNPSQKSIVVISKNRHPMDIFRTVAHELVHHKQNEDGRIKDVAREGSTGSDIENEANAEAGKIMRWFAKTNPDVFKSGYVVEETMVEGLQDPSRKKAVFLAGGPGSGKDFIMGRTLHGHGFTEVNSDTAFEHLMKRSGLDLKMPESEEPQRNVFRGRAKNIAKEKERLALTGRNGLIINGTADDPEKIAGMKAKLEKQGYKTMMVFVNTANEVSRQRNIARGAGGGREVPEKIRQEKWDAAQSAKGPLKDLFGQEDFIHVDNSDDYRHVSPERRKELDDHHTGIFKKVRKFAMTPLDSPEWEKKEMEKRGITKAPVTRATKVSTRPNKPMPEYTPNASELEQAKRLGVQHVGGGQFGASKQEPTHVSKKGQLVMAEEKKMKNDPCWKGYRMVGKKKKNGKEVPNCVPVDEAFESFMEENKPSDREWGTKSLTDIYKAATPGQTTPAYPLSEKNAKKKKKLAQEDNAPALGYEFGQNGIGPTFGVVRSPNGLGMGYSLPMTSMAESIQNWANNEKTIERFVKKYGDLAEQKLYEAAYNLNNSLINEETLTKKSIRKLREAWEAKGGRDMGTVSNASSKEEIPEQSEMEILPRDYVQKFGKTVATDPVRKHQYVRQRRIKQMDAKNYEAEHSYKSMIKNTKEPRAEKLSEDWQEINRKDKTDGLSQKAVNAYRRENPGSKLQTAVTEKKPTGKRAKRRLSFCRRMKGMKSKLTSAETSRDPDSRINKALRRWNCEE